MIFVLQMAGSTDSDGATIFKNRLDYVEKQAKLIWIMQKGKWMILSLLYH